MKKIAFLFVIITLLSSCATTSVDQVVENSPADLERQNLVYVGQSKKNFVGLEPVYGTQFFAINTMH